MMAIMENVQDVPKMCLVKQNESCFIEDMMRPTVPFPSH